MDVKEAVQSAGPRLDGLDVEDFPGCVAVPMTEAELEEYEGRLEYWAADIQTAMIAAEPTTTYREIPSHRVTGLVREIGLARGSEILALGSVDLVQFTDECRRNVLLQADAVFFLSRPWPKEKAVDVDAGPAPDVLLEVAHTTDVRRGKLSVYAALGLPEVWVEVPQPEWLASRKSGWPRGRAAAWTPRCDTAHGPPDPRSARHSGVRRDRCLASCRPLGRYGHGVPRGSRRRVPGRGGLPVQRSEV